MSLTFRSVLTLAMLLAAKSSADTIYLFDDADCPLLEEKAVCHVFPGQCCHAHGAQFQSCAAVENVANIGGFRGSSPTALNPSFCAASVGTDPFCYSHATPRLRGCKTNVGVRNAPPAFPFPYGSGGGARRALAEREDNGNGCVAATHRGLQIDGVEYEIAMDSAEYKELEKIKDKDERKKFYKEHGTKTDAKDEKKDEGKKDDGKKDDGKKDDGKKDDGKKDDGKKDDGKKAE